MKRFLLSTVLIIAFGAYVVYNHLTNAGTTPLAMQQPASLATPAKSNSPSPAATQSSGTSAAVSAPPAKAPSAGTPKGQYADGTYTGTLADAYYGNIQVEAVIFGGKLTDVVFLQYPNDRSTSRYINQQAMPQLKAEAIQTQSANVDGVSGASDSSAAFKQSLASALSQAQA